jgi:hypothetical protein
MTTRTEFIQREILPTLGEYANDYDLDAICDEVSDFDEREGYVWKDEYASDEAAYWQVVSKYDNAE